MVFQPTRDADCEKDEAFTKSLIPSIFWMRHGPVLPRGRMLGHVVFLADAPRSRTGIETDRME